MDHVAIMKKSWGLLPKILSGEKTIESRWYKVGRSPWDRVKAGDVVYFKDSGGPISAKAGVRKVLQFSDLTPKKVWEILQRYGREDGLEEEELPKYFEMFKDKKYCLLIFLKKPEQVDPFRIDKRGFGTQLAWISVEDVNQIRIEN